MIYKIFRRLLIFFVLLFLAHIGSHIISYYKTGAENISILKELNQSNLDSSVNIEWRQNALSDSNPNIIFALTKDINSAWKSINQTLYHQTEINLSDYFHEDMISKIGSSIKQAAHPINRQDVSHELELKHLSYDRSVAVLKDHKCKIVHRDLLTDQEYNFVIDTISYTAICVFSDGLWKIKNWIQEDYSESTDHRIERSDLFNANLRMINSIRGINYYPQDYPWHYFWDSTTVDILTDDFKIIKELGMNTVRVFIPYQSFSQSGKEEFYLQKLDQLMDVAAKHDLRITPTLFDFPVGFDINTYQHYTHHLNLIINHLKDHPSLLAWNIKNEPDLDFEHHGKQNVLDWLSYTIDHVRQLDPDHPITLSWSTINRLSLLADKLDFLSFHMYSDVPDWTTIIEEYRLKYNKPILLEEFGESTRAGIYNLLGKTEAYQRSYVRDIILKAKEKSIPWMLWTLYDFKQIPKGVFKPRPWIKSKQSHFGLIRQDGSKKELFLHFHENF